MARVREHAWIEKNPRRGIYYVKTNGGCISYYTNYKDAMSRVNDINNDDSNYPTWIDVPDAPSTERHWTEEMWEDSRKGFEERTNRVRERREKEAKKEEDNRKSKRSDENFVYVISLIERGKSDSTEYFKGETNLLKMENFTTLKESDAKVFKTKASAQKVVDALNKSDIVEKVYRNLKVVRKKRELFIPKS